MQRLAILGLFSIAAATAGCVPDFNGGTTPSDAASAGDSTAAVDAADAGPVSDAHADAAHDTGSDAIVDAGSDTSSIVCHSGSGAMYTYCAVGTQACCGVFAPSPDFCVPFPDTADACTYMTSPTAIISCDDPSQCPAGEVCCASNLDVGNGKYTAIQCASAASCVAPAGIACGTTLGAPNNAACPSGMTCIGTVDLYRFCQ